MYKIAAIMMTFLLSTAMCVQAAGTEAKPKKPPKKTEVMEVKKPTETKPVVKTEIKGRKFSVTLPKDPAKIPAYLQDISVTISTGDGEGSGVIMTKVDEHGNKVNFVWTAGHVVESLRSERTVVDPNTGTERRIVEFKDAYIVKDIQDGGRSVGQLKLAAEVIRYSDPTNGHDLALLRLRKPDFINTSAVFCYEDFVPLGTPLYHVGSLLGQVGSNSMTSGILSQHGRLISGSKKVFDQTTVAAFPGSSGGGVFLQDGRYIGMVVRGAGETFNLIVPIRRMREWARQAKITWALNGNEDMPSDAVMEAMPIEDVGRTWTRASDKAAAAASDGGATGGSHGSYSHNSDGIHDYFKRSGWSISDIIRGILNK